MDSSDIFDPYEFVQPPVTKGCPRCGRLDLDWEYFHGRYRLIDENGMVHKCLEEP